MCLLAQAVCRSAALSRAINIDAVLLGCGYENAHSFEERIAIQEIGKMAEVAKALLMG